MESPNNEASVWQDIIRRMEAGEAQTAIAKANGMSIGQFRYRLKKYMEQWMSAGSEVAAAADEHTHEPADTQQNLHAKEVAVAVEEAATEQTAFDFNELPVIPLMEVDESLFDDTWVLNTGRNRLTVMVKEPTTVFVYWELSEMRQRLMSEHFQCSLEQLPFFLQVYDVTDLQFDGMNANNSWRVAVHSQADNWYIHGMQPGRRYIVDYGTTTLAGHFFTILRSNVVETPPMRSHHPVLPFVQFAPPENRSAVTRCKAVLDNAEDHLPMASASWHHDFTGYNVTERRGGAD